MLKVNEKRLRKDLEMVQTFLNDSPKSWSDHEQAGRILRALGQSEVATEHFLQSATIQEQYQSDAGYPTTQMQIGNRWRLAGDSEKARRYFGKAYELWKERLHELDREAPEPSYTIDCAFLLEKDDDVERLAELFGRENYPLLRLSRARRAGDARMAGEVAETLADSIRKDGDKVHGVSSPGPTIWDWYEISLNLKEELAAQSVLPETSATTGEPNGESEGALPEPRMDRVERHLADLSGPTLRGEDLCGRDLQDKDFDEADLREADLHEARLQGASLLKACLYKANLRNTDLREAHLDEAMLDEADLRSANLQGAEMSDVGLRGSDLRGVDLGAPNGLWHADLQGANLDGANLGGAELVGADLRNTALAGTHNLNKANLEDANLSENNLRGVDLSNVHLSGADLSRAQLSGVNVSGVYMRGAILTEADLSDADLSKADLIGANLRGTNLQKANLSNATLNHADLTGADLRRANTEGAVFEGAVMDDIQR